MNGETHSQLANFIWGICNLLRGPYKRNEYRKVILPFTVLRRIGDPYDKPKDPDHIAEITRIYENFRDGETRAFNIDGKQRELVVSKVFDNEDFGYHKITVERPLRDEQGNAVVAAKGKNKGKPEPDPDLRDTETVPLKESIEDYFKREVLPHVPDAWIDHAKTKVGYEIPLNRASWRGSNRRSRDWRPRFLACSGR